MKTLKTLLKLATNKVEDKQKEIAELARVMGEMAQRKIELKALIESENIAASQAGVDVMLYQQAGIFAKKAEAEIEDINEATVDAQKIMQQKQEDMRILFSEQKRYETLLERRQQEQKRQKAKQEQSLLDEVAGNQAGKL